MLKVFAHTFMGKEKEDPLFITDRAVKFATKVEMEPFTTTDMPLQTIAPSVINMSTTAAKWGFTCTVFYKAVNRIEVDR